MEVPRNVINLSHSTFFYRLPLYKQKMRKYHLLIWHFMHLVQLELVSKKRRKDGC